MKQEMLILNLVNLLLNKLDSEITANPSKEELVELRLRLDLNTRDIAKLIGVSKRTWERYESGKYKISSSSWVYLLMIANELPGVRVLKIGE